MAQRQRRDWRDSFSSSRHFWKRASALSGGASVRRLRSIESFSFALLSIQIYLSSRRLVHYEIGNKYLRLDKSSILVVLLDVLCCDTNVNFYFALWRGALSIYIHKQHQSSIQDANLQMVNFYRACGELVKRCRLFCGGTFGRPRPRVTRIVRHIG